MDAKNSTANCAALHRPLNIPILNWLSPMLAQLAIASCVMAAGFAATAAEAKPPAPGVQAWTNSIPRAFLKDRHLRLYSGAEGERVLFKTEWKKTRVAAQEFSYAGAMLKRDTSPPALPAASSAWREIKVLDVAQGDRLIRAVAAHLVPAERGMEFYSQYAFGDVVLFATRLEQRNSCRLKRNQPSHHRSAIQPARACLSRSRVHRERVADDIHE